MNEQTLMAIIGTLATTAIGIVGWVFKKLLADCSVIKTDVEVMKIRIGEAIALKEDTKKNEENVIRLQERQEKLTSDVNVLHQAKRDIFNKLSKGD